MCVAGAGCVCLCLRCACTPSGRGWVKRVLVSELGGVGTELCWGVIGLLSSFVLPALVLGFVLYLRELCCVMLCAVCHQYQGGPPRSHTQPTSSRRRPRSATTRTPGHMEDGSQGYTDTTGTHVNNNNNNNNNNNAFAFASTVPSLRAAAHHAAMIDEAQRHHLRALASQRHAQVVPMVAPPAAAPQLLPSSAAAGHTGRGWCDGVPWPNASELVATAQRQLAAQQQQQQRQQQRERGGGGVGGGSSSRAPPPFMTTSAAYRSGGGGGDDAPRGTSARVGVAWSSSVPGLHSGHPGGPGSHRRGNNGAVMVPSRSAAVLSRPGPRSVSATESSSASASREPTPTAAVGAHAPQRRARKPAASRTPPSRRALGLFQDLQREHQLDDLLRQLEASEMKQAKVGARMWIYLNICSTRMWAWVCGCAHVRMCGCGRGVPSCSFCVCCCR